MTPAFLRSLLALSLLALTACTQTDKTAQAPPPAPVMETMTDPATGAPVIAGPVLKGTAPRTPGKTVAVGAAESPAALNTTTTAERAEAAGPPPPAAAAAERRLGSTVASIGDPSQPGFWVKTPLVQSDTNGRIVNPANGKSAKVRLIPLGGAAGGGSQVSLPALQLIGVSLTDLPTVEVYAG